MMNRVGELLTICIIVSSTFLCLYLGGLASGWNDTIKNYQKVAQYDFDEITKTNELCDDLGGFLVLEKSRVGTGRSNNRHSDMYHLQCFEGSLSGYLLDYTETLRSLRI